jgi:biotin transporter BioY
MTRSRCLKFVIAIAAASVTAVALGWMTLGGFAGSESGDMVVSSMPLASTALLLVGIVALVELELAHRTGRRSRRPIRVAAAKPLGASSRIGA